MEARAIKVCVRVRPLNRREKERKCSVVVHVQGNTIQVGNNESVAATSARGDATPAEKLCFSFDRCYTSSDDNNSTESQRQVCEELANDVISPVSAGYNSSAIIYGQAGSGKSYTMGTCGLTLTPHQELPPPNESGLLHAVSQKLFAYQMLASDCICRSEVSLMEVYNDYIIDLLSSNSATSRSILKVREHPKTGPYVQGLSRHLVHDHRDVLSLLQFACSVTDGKTQSHVILTWNLTQATFVDGIPSEITRRIQLTDLVDRRPAVYSTKASSVEERKKSDSINRSLVTFANVVTWLADASDTRLGCVRRRRRSVYIPYCDSGLTWLLKDSFGLNSCTLFIATVSPSARDISETVNTLKLASRARTIVNKPSVSEDVTVTRIKELRDQNNVLRVSLGDSGRIRAFMPLRQFTEAQEKLKQNEDLIRNLTSKWIGKWAVLVGTFGKDYEVVQRWKDFERCSGISANDSAFGSDPEDADNVTSSPLPPNNSNSEPRYTATVSVGITANPGGQSNVISPSSHLPEFGRTSAEKTSQRPALAISPPSSMPCHPPPVPTNSSLLQPSAAGSNFIRSSSMNEKLERDKAEARARRARLRERRRRDSTCDGRPRSGLEEELKVEPPRRYSVGYTLVPSAQSTESVPAVNSALVSPTKIAVTPVTIKTAVKTAAVTLKPAEVELSAAALNSKSVAVVTPAVEVKPAAAAATATTTRATETGEQNSAANATSASTMPDAATTSEKMKRNKAFVEDGSPVTQLFEHLSVQLGQVRTVVSDNMQRKFDYYTSFPAQLDANVVDSITHQLSTLRTVIDYTEKLLNVSNSDADSSSSQQQDFDKLVHYRRLVSSVDKYIEVQRLLRNVDNNLRRPVHTYSDLLDDLDRLDVVLTSLDLDQPLERQSHQVLQIELCIMRQRVLRELGEAWNKILQWEFPSIDDDLLPPEAARGPVTLNLSAISKHPEAASSVVRASSRLGRLNAELTTFADRLLSRFVRNVTRDGSTVVNVTGSSASVAADCGAGSKSKGVTPAPQPGEVFEKLEKIFTFLGRTLSEVKLNEDGTAVTTDDIENTEAKLSESNGEKLTSKVGQAVVGHVLDSVYADCLSHVVQSADTEWLTLDKIALLAERFEANLRRHLELQASTVVEGGLSDRLLPACKKAGAARCGHLLATAHMLMTRELAESVRVSVDCLLGSVQSTGSAGTGSGKTVGKGSMDDFVQQCREEAGTTAYRLPTCSVSTSVCQLVCLAYETLQDAVHGSKQGASILYQALKDVFELFCDVMPFYHRERLGSLSLHAALHHNNCMFVAHHLITIDKIFHQKLSPLIQQLDLRSSASSSNGSSPSDDGRRAFGSGSSGAAGGRLCDLVSWVKRLGNDNFTQHIITKKHQLCQLLQETKGFTCIADDDGFSVSHVLDKIMEQLKHIAKVWSDVLPTNAFNRSLGSLLNSILRDIIQNVVSINEFSVDDCSCLQRVLTTVLNNAVNLFQSSCPLPAASSTTTSSRPSGNVEVILQECIPVWMKYRELVGFFGLGLTEVSDRWADGKGPLAMHLTGHEVARLVVAIFERTSRRDKLVEQLQRKPSVHATQ